MLRGYGDVGVMPTKNPIETYMACMSLGKIPGRRGAAKGVDVCISSWNRIAPNTLPALAKAGANYMNSQLIRMEAGDERICRRDRARRGRLCQRGLGREHVRRSRRQGADAAARRFRLAGHHARHHRENRRTIRHSVVETIIPREMLYIADEVFFTGTAAEVTPIRSVDRIQVGEGRRGPITAQIQRRFFEIVQGERPMNSAG